MHKALNVVVAGLWAWCAPAHACSDASLSAEGAAEVSSFLAGAVERKAIPGVVALVVGCQGAIYHEAFGMQDVGRGRPMQKDSIFRIASMTKPITSLAVMRLVEDGRVRLDDEARTWVPALAAPRVLADVDLDARRFTTREASSPITVRQLLTHTSGIGYEWSDPRLALVQQLDKSVTDADSVLVSEPGTLWTYGSGTNALGEIIVSLTGKPLDRALRRSVLDPLGMAETTFVVPDEKQDRVTAVHRRMGTTTREDPNPDPVPGYVSADGGLFSTAEDYGRLVRMLLNGGEIDGTRVLTTDTMRAIGSPQMGDLLVRAQPAANPHMTRPYPLGAGIDTWGLGFQITGRSDEPVRRSEGSLSWAGLFNTFFWADPARGVGAVLMMQVLPFYDEQAIALLQGFEERIYRHLD